VAEIWEGNPKIPLPIMQLIVSAARLQRPIARTSVGWPGPGIAGLYHRIASQTKITQNQIAGTNTLVGDNNHFPRKRLPLASIVRI
jgi:hypothetical protein